jgi:hypothetical protein
VRQQYRHGAPRRPAEAEVSRCPARELVLRPGTFVVPMTGEHAVMYALTKVEPTQQATRILR